MKNGRYSADITKNAAFCFIDHNQNHRIFEGFRRELYSWWIGNEKIEHKAEGLKKMKLFGSEESDKKYYFANA